LGGALFAAARSLPFILDGLSFLCSMTLLSLTRARFQSVPRRPSVERRAVRSEVLDGIAWLWRRPFFRVTALLFAAGNPIFTGLYLLAILLAKQYGASAATVGLMLALVGIGGVLGALLAGTLRRMMTARAIVLAQEWLLLTIVLGLLLVRSPLLIGLLIGVVEFITPAVNSAVAGARVAAAPDRLQGRIQAAATMSTMSLAWLGPLMVDVCFGHFGASATVVVLAASTLALATAATFAPALRESPLSEAQWAAAVRPVDVVASDGRAEPSPRMPRGSVHGDGPVDATRDL
jgi:predicted MFS family arabinose efflux permease